MKNIDGKGNSILYSASQSGMTKILNLIMEYEWWKNCLEQQKKSKEQDWKSFVCNVCAAGCICEGLAKITCLERQKKSKEQDWKSFVCNVCAAGCEGPAKIICLERQKKSNEQDWKSFVCNVCAAGCEGLAKIILQEDSGLPLKWEEEVTPLMR